MTYIQSESIGYLKGGLSLDRRKKGRASESRGVAEHQLRQAAVIRARCIGNARESDEGRDVLVRVGLVPARFDPVEADAEFVHFVRGKHMHLIGSAAVGSDLLIAIEESSSIRISWKR